MSDEGEYPEKSDWCRLIPIKPMPRNGRGQADCCALVVTGGPDRGTILMVEPGEDNKVWESEGLVVGSEEGATLVLKDEAVHPAHFRIFWSQSQYYGEGYQVQDLGSVLVNGGQNGVMVNNLGLLCMVPTQVRDGDLIRAGKSRMEFVSAPSMEQVRERVVKVVEELAMDAAGDSMDLWRRRSLSRGPHHPFLRKFQKKPWR